ncbi:Heterokaryon incompatibility protein 6,OR allele [Lachnellula willkommii]|uniref:Heterokaryon incompatibility protein 6,OR allele n=1 Tax=Lachnellula willkommii TaxID=215461 RepID=A0A559M2V8_9HELO|nr:Heterokaryon incompatibility protein 6,OR allele [Lachnellula willkommii]
MSYFVYRSLTPHKKRIRLVHVLPANDRPSIEQDLTQQPDELNPSHPSIANNLICCTISHASLDNAPPFTALSYSWGDQTQRCEILLNGAPISITKNLESALRHLRLQDKPLTLWIDALCIDQSDDVEKGEQIEQMGQIYSEALSVITWLGPAADNSDVAMQWNQRYGVLASELGVGSCPELQLRRLLEKADLCGTESVEREIQTFIEDLKIQLSRDSAEQLMCVAAVEQLLKRPYWSRVWVVQELVSASNTLFSNRSLPTHLLMRSLRKFGATDPRDKVFALLGIAGDAEALGLHPDYRKSCEEVYTELALTLIRNGYHDPLSLSDSSRDITGLPSWAPDWSTKSCRHPLQERSLNRSTRPLTTILQPNFSASGIKATLEVPRRDTIIRSMPLLLHGAVLGTVGQLGMVWEGDVGAWLQDLRRLSHPATDTIGLSEGRQKIAWRTAVADQEIRQGNTKPKLSEEKISSVHETLKDKDLSLTQVQTMIDAGLGDYYEQLQVVAQGRRPLLASSGHLGIGPNETQPGDVLVIFLIAQVPYILRRHSEHNTLRLVGEAYVHGLMNGEAMKGSLATEIIPLC